MNLGLSALFLILGSVLSISATSDEDKCRNMATPLSTPFEPQLGRWNFVLGYIDSGPHKVLFKTTVTQWIQYVKNVTDSKTAYYQKIGIKHTTYCKTGTFPMTLYQNSAIMEKTGFTCTYRPLPTCTNCLLYLINARNNDIVVDSKENTNPQTIREVKQYRAFYMMIKDGHTMEQSDIQHGMDQAKCLGFTGDPDFLLNSSEYCETPNDNNNNNDNNSNEDD